MGWLVSWERPFFPRQRAVATRLFQGSRPRQQKWALVLFLIGPSRERLEMGRLGSYLQPPRDQWSVRPRLRLCSIDRSVRWKALMKAPLAFRLSRPLRVPGRGSALTG